MPHADPSPPPFRRKPPRAETARANGARSRGPVTEAGRRRSSLNAVTHGLRARRYLAVPALGEDPAEAAAHLAAVRAELGAVGPVARHLAETAASGLLRAARAERLEGELLAGVARAGGSVARSLCDDRDARATLALVHRYRRDADGDVRRSLESLLRLRRAQADGLLPGEDEVAGAQADLDETVAELPAPNKPRIEKIQPPQWDDEPANDDRHHRAAPAPAPAFVLPPRPAVPPPPPEPPRVFTGADYLRQHRWFRTEAERDRYRRCLKPHQLAMMLAAEAAERPADAAAP